MATAPQQGGAQALPIARAFLDIGGRLLINPKGKLETAMDAERAFSSRRCFVIGRRFVRRLRDPRFARSVATLVAVEGDPVNGWLVMEARS